MPTIPFFQLQLLAQEILSAQMNQVAEFFGKKLGYCPAFLMSQEPIGLHGDPRLKVTVSFTLDNRSKDFNCAGHLSNTSSILAASPSIAVFPCTSYCGNHGGNLFSAGLCSLCTAFLFCPFFVPVLNLGFVRTRRKYSTNITVSDPSVRSPG